MSKILPWVRNFWRESLTDHERNVLLRSWILLGVFILLWLLAGLLYDLPREEPIR